MKMNVDLGTDGSEILKIGAPRKNPDTFYPCLYLTLPEDSDVRLPEEGTITFRYRQKGASASVRYDDDEKSVRRTVDLEILAILAVDKGTPAPTKLKTAEEAMSEAFEEDDED